MAEHVAHELDNVASSSKGIKRPLSNSVNVTCKSIRKSNKTASGEIQTKVKVQTKSTVTCELCYQINPEIVTIPCNAEFECIVLTNEVLANIYTDKLDVIKHNLTNYSVYDENGHLCSMDSGIIEQNKPIYLTGYVKPIYDYDSSIENGIAVKQLGSILEWFLESYDCGSKIVIGVSTNYADYLLVEPHPSYRKYMTSIFEKVHLSKVVVERLVELKESDDPSYEDILNYVVNSVNPVTNIKFTEENLISHAQFVIDQVDQVDYESTTEYNFPLVGTQFIETLKKLSGDASSIVKMPPRRLNIHRTNSLKYDISKQKYSKATTTYLVNDIFEKIFTAQLEQYKNENVVVINEQKTVFDDIKLSKKVIKTPQELSGKYIIVKEDSSINPIIGHVQYLFQNCSKTMAHIILFIHGNHTILGDTSDPRELYLLEKCTDIDIKNVIQIADVKFKKPCKDWFKLGNAELKDISEPVDRNKINAFFYQFQYHEEFGRFEHPETPETLIGGTNQNKYCTNCVKKNLKIKSQVPELFEFVEKYKNQYFHFNYKLNNEEYKIGDFIYLKPGIFTEDLRINFEGQAPFVFNDTNKNENSTLPKNICETKYPEHYRKNLENTMRGSNESTPEPFEIAEILSMHVTKNFKSNVQILVRRMYRADQIPLGNSDKNADMNLLFWSDEQFKIKYDDIVGKCYVSHINNVQDLAAWFADGPDRFYFENKYNFLTCSIVPECQLSSVAIPTKREVNPVNYINESKKQSIPSYKKISPLRGLDIFAGCGGLSKGLEDSGLLKCKWAIEYDDNAAEAFKLNNPDTIVFVEDCNALLKLAMSGKTTNKLNQKIPQKGEVDIICGGPPCQGFSGMNRFNSGQYSLFRNSLIVSFLSYIDFYRPKFFIMENVRNFVSFNKGTVIRSTLRCITRMGYQCTFGILQAGNFGVPQTRRRLIIMAAAPGETLPFYPEPTHVFNKRNSSLNVQIGGKKYKTNCKYKESAPMRTVTVYDAWSDLPEIKNGANNEAIPYKHKPKTHLQQLLRYPNNLLSESILTDHICKDMSLLVQARMELIPISEGSDWRDLPNIEVQLADGNWTNTLVYRYHDQNNGKGPGGAFRGVCQCASGKKCNPQDKQTNTIIPWCLPHTANRNNNWAGLYGRLAWKGFCSTTITNPEPMGKQGRVLHPNQHRVVSVRECARSQGFNDAFLFYGPIINKHRQIGNAVPPPMGKAIGHEIINAIYKKSHHFCTTKD
ncbi:DNA (cytosine-5)-methyltransferase 1-like,Bromo adjacent homology (BAH) domain,DNA (cytosine-5)- [Cinara cedri]|uniref:Cytosine-specific methyltransferase n=1 Tax=Cinara cedri TaxID=506608 RepID=A0A5E4MBU6_9HEMI|nr:DNA (cytosine-5)-methyltransferase 1-like,Bromo adjacent homology (BAH) domain,DNA (cytosine-5)- [Cinara cedri]